MLGRYSISRLTEKLALGTGLLLIGSASWAGMGTAGGAIDYVPLASSVAAVPTLGEWMLVLVALLISVVAFRGLRGRVNGRLLSNMVLAGGALAATLAGHGLIQEVKADMAIDEQNMYSPSGGTVTGTYWTRLTNTSGVPLKIKAIRPNVESRVVSPPPESPECTVNSIVSPGEKCDILFEFLSG